MKNSTVRSFLFLDLGCQVAHFFEFLVFCAANLHCKIAEATQQFKKLEGDTT